MPFTGLLHRPRSMIFAQLFDIKQDFNSVIIEEQLIVYIWWEGDVDLNVLVRDPIQKCMLEKYIIRVHENPTSLPD